MVKAQYDVFLGASTSGMFHQDYWTVKEGIIREAAVLMD
jgi:hypothetical protein